MTNPYHFRKHHEKSTCWTLDRRQHHDGLGFLLDSHLLCERAYSDVYDLLRRW